MRILALEASGSRVGLAAVETNESRPAIPVAVNELADTRMLSQHLMNGFAATLAQAGWTLDSVEAIGVGIGPGSWTSLRVALSTVKTLAQVRNWKLVGVPSFDAVALALWGKSRNDEAIAGVTLPKEFLVAVVGRCRPGEVYAKLFDCSTPNLTVLQPEWVSSPEGVVEALRAESLMRDVSSLVIAGEGCEPVAALLRERGIDHFVVELSVEEQVVQIGRSTESAIAWGGTHSPLELQPLYVAPSAAERNLQK